MRRRNYLLVLALLLVVMTSASCAKDTSDKPDETKAPTANSEAVAKPEVPAPTVEVSWFWTDGDAEEPLFRFVAMISNPGSKPIVGMETEWVAYDVEGTIVGSYKGQRPVIPAGGSIPYCGGAGGANLTGVPASVQVTVTNVGSFADEAPISFAVSEVTLTADATNEYTVAAKATSGDTDVQSSILAAYVVLKDASGNIVGGDFWLPEGLPENLPAGSTFKIEIPYIPTTAAATSAEVTVVQEQ